MLFNLNYLFFHQLNFNIKVMFFLNTFFLFNILQFILLIARRKKKLYRQMGIYNKSMFYSKVK